MRRNRRRTVTRSFQKCIDLGENVVDDCLWKMVEKGRIACLPIQILHLIRENDTRYLVARRDRHFRKHSVNPSTALASC